MQERIVFSSDDLPAHLSDDARFSLWHDIHNANISSLEYSISEGRRFYARIEAMSVGSIAVGEMACSITTAERGKSNIAVDNIGGHNLFVNSGVTPIGGIQAGREFFLDPGAAVLMSSSEPLKMFGRDDNAWMSVILPHNTLGQAFTHLDDHVSQAVAADSEALVLLRRYNEFLKAGAPLDSPHLQKHAADTIIDLVGLAVGIKGQDAELGGASGLRAARLAAVASIIGREFSNPAFSAQMAARELGLSVRYVHDLLHETGAGFAERVMELRLQMARNLLVSPESAHMRISNIAFQCGFSDISHFNRRFRLRFGCTPTAAR